MPTIPDYITNQITTRGLSAVIDEVTSREEMARAEMLYWKVIRQGLEELIPAPVIDEALAIVEAAFNVH